MIVLFDFNLTGYVVLFQGTLAAEGWVEIASIRLMRSACSSDCAIATLNCYFVLLLLDNGKVVRL